MLSALPDPIWADRPESSALYLSKLVVARDHAGAGLGERILADVERIARERGADWLRLDCVASNELLARYYQRQGYYPRGVVRGLLRHDKRIIRGAGCRGRIARRRRAGAPIGVRRCCSSSAAPRSC